MTLKAMIATLALLPSFTGIIPVAHAETLDSTQAVAVPNTVDFGTAQRPVVYPDFGCAGAAGPPRVVAHRTFMPQPKTLMLCGLGLLLFGWHHRRK